MTEEEFLAMAGEQDQNPEPNDKGEPPSQNDRVSISSEEEQNNDAEEDSNEPHSDPSNLNKTEQEAYNLGWRPESEYEGKTPWRDASTFLEVHKLNSKIHELNARDKKRNDEIEKRLNEVYKFQIENIKRDAEKQKQKIDAAVEEGDVSAFKAYQAELDELNKKQATMATYDKPTVEADPDIQSWISQNPWITTDTSKASVADTIFADITNKNPQSSTKEHLAMLDDKLSAIYNETPRQNLNRIAPSTNESRTSVSRPTKRELTMSDLTHEEQEAWRILGNKIFKGNQKDFLNSVKNSRQK